MNIVLALLVFSFIVFIHELGHFIFAKLNKIEVIEFSIGMGPRILSFDYKNTKYSIKLLPIGGSCMMKGEDDGTNIEKGSFASASVLGRISVVLAGPVFNFILAAILSVILTANVGYEKPVVYDVIDGYPAQEAGLRADDIITSINGERVVIYSDIHLILFNITNEKSVSVNYDRIENGETISGTIEFTPKFDKESGRFLIGIQGGNTFAKASPLEVIKYGTYQVVFVIRSTIKTLGMMISGQVSTGEIAGPVGIVNMVGEAVESSKPAGTFYVIMILINFSILLSANLGVMNLLPIPALDGGRLVFLFIEAIMKRPISREKEGIVHTIGFMLLMLLMVFVLFNDIKKLFGF